LKEWLAGALLGNTAVWLPKRAEPDANYLGGWGSQLNYRSGRTSIIHTCKHSFGLAFTMADVQYLSNQLEGVSVQDENYDTHAPPVPLKSKVCCIVNTHGSTSR
jgi:hypothetical protein